MSRIFDEGLEGGDLLFFTSTVQASVTSVNPISGRYSLLLSTLGVAAKNVNALSQAYFRMAIDTLATGTLFKWRFNAVELGSIRINVATRLVEIYTSTGTLVATGSVPVPYGGRCVVEIYVKIADAGTIGVKLDGTENVTFTGDTKPTADANMNNIQYTLYSGRYDDLAMNDTTGATNNSWCGDERIMGLLPNGNGDASQLTGSDGNQVDNYALVDELIANGETDYVEGSVVNYRDLYSLEACGLSGVTIKQVQIVVWARDTVGAGGQISLPLKTESVEHTSPQSEMETLFPLATSYAPVWGDQYFVNPTTGLAWTVEQLDALQIGAKVKS